MVKAHPETRFTFLFDRAYDESFVYADNVHPVVVPPPSRHPILWYIWFHQTLKFKLRKLKPDLFYSPEFYLTAAREIPQVSVIHDLAYEHFPEDVDKWAARYYKKYSPRYAHQARRILTVSEFSKQDIVSLYGIDPQKITVAPNACNDFFKPVSEEVKIATRKEFSDGKPYFYFVGTIQPRKNIERLLQAFDLFRERVGESIKLLIVGRKGWKYEGAMQAFEGMKYKDEVSFTGFVSDEELNRICASSVGLCYVPYLEGFGIPLVEAMYSETAIISSNITAMPEVVGDAALLVDPYQSEQIADKMLELYRSPQLRKQLIEKGAEQRQQFSWDRSAEIIWSVLVQSLGK